METMLETNKREFPKENYLNSLNQYLSPIPRVGKKLIPKDSLFNKGNHLFIHNVPDRIVSAARYSLAVDWYSRPYLYTTPYRLVEAYLDEEEKPIAQIAKSYPVLIVHLFMSELQNRQLIPIFYQFLETAVLYSKVIWILSARSIQQVQSRYGNDVFNLLSKFIHVGEDLWR